MNLKETASATSVAQALATQPELHTARLTLQQLGPQHIDGVLSALTDEEAMRSTGTHRKFSRGEVLRHLEGLPGAGDRADFAIFDDAGAYLGEVVLNDLDVGNLSMNYRIVLAGAAARGRGYGTEAGRAVTEWAFKIGIHRVYLDVYSFNVAARRSYEKIGFQVEGRARHTLLWNGEWADSTLMAILSTDPLPSIG
ncbi:GCN5 family acetyltransferase [Microbacterium sp. SZ1]|uniref:GNAT family N-acetyltransferase n=1 Tax=Microbacterium sp. SZ1 TaxID=1849736 RepID=UPI000BBC6866|nr:GNAT family protein [Microbacterium sp. SZ1]PCE16331.1 GCN5 family acetyltransferase [Microbacterium sp. SZ1]